MSRNRTKDEPANLTPERLMSSRELADHVGVPLATIYQWRVKGTGPHGFMVGKHLRYRVSDVNSWLDKLAAK